MHRLLLIALCTSACGSATDDRPATLDYITATILTPTCASAECHSSFTREVNDRFDTVSATRYSIVVNQLVPLPDSVADPRGSYLIKSLTIGVSSLLGANGLQRMPYDAPLPDADLHLIEKWISEGAEGAQCVPNDQGQSCSFTPNPNEPGKVIFHVVECPDGNLGKVVQDCVPDVETCAITTNNGKCMPAPPAAQGAP